MPNFKVFQDNPDHAKIKIFGANNIAFNTDAQGNLTITSTGLAITPPADGLTITSTGLAITSEGLAITPPAGGLMITSTGLAITPPADGLTITSTGLAITPPADGLLITSAGLAIATATTDVSYVLANIEDTAGSPDQTYNVLGIKTWSFGVVNNALAANAQALVALQVSPDAQTWQDEVGPVTIDQNGLKIFVANVFIKYARLYYKAVNASSAVTLNVFFQGQI